VRLVELEPVLEKHERELLVRTRYLVERLPPRMPTEAELAPLIYRYRVIGYRYR